MHITVCKICHRVLALSWSTHEREDSKNFTRLGTAYKHPAVKLIPESYRQHMARCPKVHEHDNLYDVTDPILRYELK